MLLHEYMEYFAREAPDQLCVEMEVTSFSYDEANRRCNQIAHACTAAGLQPGDRFAWLSKNSIDLMLIFYAASKVGVIPVPLNYRLAPAEWQYIINDCRARALVCDSELCEAIDSVRDDLEHIEIFLATGAGTNALPQADWSGFDNWIAERPDTQPDHYGKPEDALYQMYTSGTTGLPKGAVLSQRAIDNNTRMIGTEMGIKGRDTRFLLVLPMYHAAAGISHKAMVSVGGSVIIHREFNPLDTVDALQEKKITNCTLVPAMIQACLVHVADINDREFPDLDAMAYGASPIADEILRRAMAVFKCDFLQVFGMTETTAVSTILSAAAHRRALAGEVHLLSSCGRAAVGTHIRIVDDNGDEVDRGTVGEISVRGPQLMTTYWNLPEATEKTLRDGWLMTGDAAYMDDEGYIFIQDRIKDMIVSGGENVYPAEVESALFEHPNVADAAVIGIPSERWGETILAFLVTRDGKPIDTDEVIAFCRDRLAGYKIPREVKCIEEIPRNPSGKVLKKDLREPYWEGIERRVG
jgi:acyl-CoA synthetase (AMP-forming)/AMP-acid ligase II